MATFVARSRFKTLYANTNNASSDPCLHRLGPSTPSSSECEDASNDVQPASPSHSVSSSQDSTVENGTPNKNSQTDNRRLVAGRQLPRRFWQQDREADHCSILACQKKFADWSILTSQRHHCRSCGRVICHACSTGTRLLLPPRGEKGQARAVRVCDACLQNQETYNYCPSPKAASQPSSSAANSLSVSVSKGSPPNGALEEDNGGEKGSVSCSVEKGGEDGGGRPSLLRSNSAPSLVKLAEGDSGSEANVSGVAEGEEAACEPQPAPDKPNSNPVQVPNKKWSAREAATEDVMEGMGEVDERVRRVQAAFATSSYYHGLLRHEPAALRMLILAEATQEPPQASA